MYQLPNAIQDAENSTPYNATRVHLQAPRHRAGNLPGYLLPWGFLEPVSASASHDHPGEAASPGAEGFGEPHGPQATAWRIRWTIRSCSGNSPVSCLL